MDIHDFIEHYPTSGSTSAGANFAVVSDA